MYKSSLSWETTETSSDLKQQKCQWIHQKLFLSPVKWIMRAKKTDLNDNTEFLFKLADGHCVLRLFVWSATVKNNYKRAASQHFSNKRHRVVHIWLFPCVQCFLQYATLGCSLQQSNISAFNLQHVEITIIKCINCDCATKMFYVHALVLWNMYLNMYNQLIVDQN